MGAVLETGDETINFGGTFPFYKAFADMMKAAGGPEAWVRDWPDLSGIADAVEGSLDADALWLADARSQAREFLAFYKDDLTRSTVGMLEHFIDGEL